MRRCRLVCGVLLVLLAWGRELGASAAAPTARTERHVSKGDPRVQVVSPAEGQVFAPGDTVNATVQLEAPLAARAGWLAVATGGLIEGTNYNGSTYEVSFAIPDDFAGPLELTPDITDSSGRLIEGVSVTIAVRPSTAPLRLRPVQAHEFFSSIGEKGQLFVQGEYPGGRTLHLTSSASGTVYESSDPRVIAVDAEGNVEAIGWGAASVRATNQGVKTYFTVAVEDAHYHPLPPQDLTARVRFEKGPLTLDEADRRLPLYLRTVTVSVTVINTSGWPIVGPLYLAVRDLPAEVGWRGWGVPPGKPEYFLGLELKDAVTIFPDERVTRSLEFVGVRTPAGPSYRLGLVRCRCDPNRQP